MHSNIATQHYKWFAVRNFLFAILDIYNQVSPHVLETWKSPWICQKLFQVWNIPWISDHFPWYPWIFVSLPVSVCISKLSWVELFHTFLHWLIVCQCQHNELSWAVFHTFLYLSPCFPVSAQWAELSCVSHISLLSPCLPVSAKWAVIHTFLYCLPACQCQHNKLSCVPHISLLSPYLPLSA